MPEYLSPGVYVEEIEIGGKPIEGVSTSTAGFVGMTERGPAGVRLITGYGEYQRLYGDYVCVWKKKGDVVVGPPAAPEKDQKKPDVVVGPPAAPEKKGEVSYLSYLPYMVEGFFGNGGKRCFVARITGKESTTASASIPPQNGKTPIVVSAIGPGEWGNRIGVAIRSASMAKEGDKTIDIFKIVVFYWSEKPPQPIVDPLKGPQPIVDPLDRNKLRDPNRREPAAHEEFDNLTWDPGSTDYYKKRILAQSHLIEVSAGPESNPGDIHPGNILLLDGGKDAPVEVQDYKGDDKDDNPSGLAAFVGEDDISIVCAANEGEFDDLSDAVVQHCEKMQDRFAVLQAKVDAGEIGDLFPVGGKLDSKYAAFYYPWLKINDPVTNMPKLIPPGGHVAGIYARSDIERGVHKAPANEPIRGVIDLQFDVNKGEQEILNPRGVNCIRSFRGRGPVVWGARTISTDPLWKYVNVRRLFLFLEKSIERATQWVVFEPNTERLWARVRQSVSDFLTQVWKDGALMGTTPEQAFFVKCDETTMTANEIETGKLIIVVGVAPARPAEFVIFRLAQWRSGSSITE
jgi:uncharacterized protein